MDLTDLPPAEPSKKEVKKFELRRLSPKHKQVASLLAQGLGREEIGSLCGITPEYVTMLSKQPLFIEYVKEMTKFTDLRLQAIFDQATDVLASTMRTGSENAKLNAARITLQANNKAGNVKVDGTIHHKHSLLRALASMPEIEVPFHNGTPLPAPAIDVTPPTASTG